MRLGEEARGKRLLDEAFEIDPFNVRVNNTLKVLEVLDGYETLETEHFRIKFDPENDRLLARYMANGWRKFIRSCCQQMGFAPPEKSLFEIFSRRETPMATGGSARGWSACRTSTPIGAVRARSWRCNRRARGSNDSIGPAWSSTSSCTSSICNRPTSTFRIGSPKPWQCINEGYPRRNCVERIAGASAASGQNFQPRNDQLWASSARNRATLDAGLLPGRVVRAHMLERFGDDAVAKMLAAYGDNLTTTEALQRALGVEQNDFERGYQEYVKKIVAALPPSTVTTEMNLAELQKAWPRNRRTRSCWPRWRRRNWRVRVTPKRAAWPTRRWRSIPQRAGQLRAGSTAPGRWREQRGFGAARRRARPRSTRKRICSGLLAGLKLKSDDFAGAADSTSLAPSTIRPGRNGSSRWPSRLFEIGR